MNRIFYLYFGPRTRKKSEQWMWHAPDVGRYVPLGVPVGPMVTLCGNTINGRCLIQRCGVCGYVWAWLGAWPPREKHSRPGSNSYAWPLRHAHLSPMRQCNCRGVYSVQLECTFTWRRGGYSDTKHILCSCQTQLSSIKRYDLSRNSGPNAPYVGRHVPLGVPVVPMVTLCGNTINGRCPRQRDGVFGYVWALLGAWPPRGKK